MTTAAAQPRQTVTRNDLIALGRSGRPRDYAAVAVEVLRHAPGDAGLRFLLSANLAQLGLRTLAGESLDALPEAAAGEPDVRALREAIDRLPDDRMSEAERLETALANMRALRVRGLDLGEAFAAWRERLGRSECFRCMDGNLVRRLGWEGAPHWTHFLTDQRGAAARFAEGSLSKVDLFPRPLAVEGIDPPWLFDLAWRRLPRNRVGYAPPITVVQADAQEFLDGLSTLDLREQLVDPRVRVFVGEDASRRWLADALERLGEVVLGAVVSLPATRTKVEPGVEAVMGRAMAAQAEEFRRLQARVEARYAGRDGTWWARRFAEAASGGPALRVLVPTSRYSTYIRHAAEDLADAFRALGCEAEVAMEAGPSSRPSTVGHLAWVDRFEPDLIALINYFRGDAGLPFPANIPWLCWVQDALPHQFKAREFGELDFVAGHVHKELLNAAGFPREQAVQFPVVASERKFHSGPVDAGLGERFACEVAYVSHQSETPMAFHRRCQHEDGDPAGAAVLEALRPLVEAEAVEPMGRSLVSRLERLTAEVVETSALRSPERAQYIFRHYALPLADRVIRHQTLAWAGAICARRRWRLSLFGRGWEEHPELASLARGELAHGEELRACYQRARVHLHASVNTLVHQRVMECALSGGLPLARLTYDAVSESTGFAAREALLHHHPDKRDATTGRIGFTAATCPPIARMAEQLAGVGVEFPETVWIKPSRAESYRRPDHPGATGLHAAWLFGDLGETTFRSESELERLLERGVHDPAWRAATSEAIAGRVRERASTDAFARRVLGLLTGSLGLRGDGGRSPAA